MPLSSYTIMHKETRLSIDEKTMLIEWATKIKGTV